MRVRIHDFDGPAEFLEAMRDADITRKHKNLVYVQALKLLQTTGRPKAPKRRRRRTPSRCAAGGRGGAARAGEQELMQAGRAKGAARGLVKEIAERAGDRRRDQARSTSSARSASSTS